MLQQRHQACDAREQDGAARGMKEQTQQVITELEVVIQQRLIGLHILHQAFFRQRQHVWQAVAEGGEVRQAPVEQHGLSVTLDG